MKPPIAVHKRWRFLRNAPGERRHRLPDDRGTSLLTGRISRSPVSPVRRQWRRRHLVELEDKPWFPATLRDCMTDLLNHQITLLRLYDPIVPILAAGLRATGSTEILDLCSGGGGPLRLIQAELAARHHLTVAVRLSDLYPNFDAFRRAERAAAGRIRFVPVPVDATQVSDDLDGFRTMFTSLHHFRPDYAREILQDAVDHRRGIGVFEFTERSVAGLASMVLSPLLTLAVTPWIRPWRWSRLLMTYVLPILPATYLFDGVVSQLRTYTPGELCEMTASLSGPPYDWAIGRKRHRLLPINITYLVGHPAQLMPRAVESLREITTERA